MEDIWLQSGGHNSCKLSDCALRNLAQDIHQDQRQHLINLAPKYHVHHSTYAIIYLEIGFWKLHCYKKPYLNLVE